MNTHGHVLRKLLYRNNLAPDVEPVFRPGATCGGPLVPGACVHGRRTPAQNRANEAMG